MPSVGIGRKRVDVAGTFFWKDSFFFVSRNQCFDSFRQIKGNFFFHLRKYADICTVRALPILHRR